MQNPMGICLEEKWVEVVCVMGRNCCFASPLWADKPNISDRDSHRNNNQWGSKEKTSLILLFIQAALISQPLKKW